MPIGVYQDAGGVRRLEGNPIDGRSNRFPSGAAALTDTLAAALPSGTLQLGTPVTAIRAIPTVGQSVALGPAAEHEQSVPVWHPTLDGRAQCRFMRPDSEGVWACRRTDLGHCLRLSSRPSCSPPSPSAPGISATSSGWTDRYRDGTEGGSTALIGGAALLLPDAPRPWRRRFPVRPLIPTIRHASVLLTPCCMGRNYAARSAVSFFRPCGCRSSRISKSMPPLELGCVATTPRT
ncbi:hypothetical protein ACFCXF_32260 [Streptomyces virginiae]|uniref:hypothetical protein n=1 Tax=Streptomyces virginiae TaxID=1961 RepID=UPI00131B72F8|nr:hypothetical protein [Streptomyces virginiae]